MPHLQDRDESDDDWEEEHESDDEATEETIPCRYCREMIHEDSVQCPHCENYLSAEERTADRKSFWIVVGLIVCLLASILMAFGW